MDDDQAPIEDPFQKVFARFRRIEVSRPLVPIAITGVPPAHRKLPKSAALDPENVLDISTDLKSCQKSLLWSSLAS